MALAEGPIEQRVEVDLEPRHPLADVVAGEDGRVDLADLPDRPAVDQHLARPRRGAAGDLGVGRRPGARPAAVRPACHTSTAAGASLARPAVPRRARARRAAADRLAAAGTRGRSPTARSRAGDESHCGRTRRPTRAAARCRRTDSSATSGLASSMPFGGRPHRASWPGARNGNGRHSVHPRPASRRRTPAPLALPCRQPADARRRQLPSGDVAVPVVAGHLLDHIDLGRGVIPPRRDDDVVIVAHRRCVESDRGQELSDPRRREVGAEDVVDPRRSARESATGPAGRPARRPHPEQPWRRRSRWPARRTAPRPDRSSPDRSPCRSAPTPRCGGPSRREVRLIDVGSNHAISRRTSVVRGGDLARRAAHDARDADRRVLGIADQQVVGGERPF